MTHRRKILVAVLAGLGVLLLCGTAAVRLLLSDERLAAFARDRVKTNLGRELVVDDLSLQFRPLPTIRLKNASLGNASWAKESYLLRADQATARLELSSLLRGRLEIASLAIEGLSVNLEVSPDGRKNWQMQGKPIAGDAKKSSIAPLHSSSVRLSEVKVRYIEHGKAAKDFQIDELKARAGSGWRDVRIDARLIRNGIPLEASAVFADLSTVGQDFATSDARIDLALGPSRLELLGLLPISGSLHKHDLKLAFIAPSSKELLGFFGMADLNLAPMKLNVDLQEDKEGIRASNLAFEIGRQKIAGNAQITVAGGNPRYRASLAADGLDWAQLLRDFGRPELPPKPPGQLFRGTPLGWRAVSALQAVKGTTDLRIKRVKLRSGIEWKNLTARIESDEKLLRIEKFSFAMLDGQANGSLLLGGEQRSARLNLDLDKVSLGKWLAARGHRLALTGGPMDLKASLSGKGLSMKDLAESMTGPVTISVGAAKLQSKQVQQAEAWLVGLAPAFSASEADQVNLACISAYLPFRNGRAAAEPIGGIRSDASQLLASGYIDLKQQTMDLRGRVRARSGVSLGVSNIAGDNLKIAGKITAPGVGLDPEGTPGALARIGAAIMTSGVSILATALWDAANPASDPCQITLRSHEKKRVSKERKVLADQSGAETN